MTETASIGYEPGRLGSSRRRRSGLATATCPTDPFAEAFGRYYRSSAVIGSCRQRVKAPYDVARLVPGARDRIGDTGRCRTRGRGRRHGPRLFEVVRDCWAASVETTDRARARGPAMGGSVVAALLLFLDGPASSRDARRAVGTSGRTTWVGGTRSSPRSRSWSGCRTSNASTFTPRPGAVHAQIAGILGTVPAPGSSTSRCTLRWQSLLRRGTLAGGPAARTQ